MKRKSAVMSGETSPFPDKRLSELSLPPDARVLGPDGRISVNAKIVYHWQTDSGYHDRKYDGAAWWGPKAGKVEISLGMICRMLKEDVSAFPERIEGILPWDMVKSGRPQVTPDGRTYCHYRRAETLQDALSD